MSDGAHSLAHYVLEYLIEHCYRESAIALARSIDENISEALPALDERQRYLTLVRTGQVDEVIRCLQEGSALLARIPADHPIWFRLRCQQFIELVRSGRSFDALQVAQSHFTLSPTVPSSQREIIQDMMLLLAYENVADAPTRHYLSDAHREETAIRLNEALLGSAARPRRPMLELIVRHVTLLSRLLHEARRSEDDDDTENEPPFDLAVWLRRADAMDSA